MRAPAQALSGQFRRSPVFLIGFLVFIVVAAFKVSDYVLADDIFGLAYAALVFIGGAVVIGILNSWRNGLYLFLGWMLFEDLARKYLGNNMAIFFAKDFLVAVVYLSFFVAYRRKEVQPFRPPFLLPLLIFVWFGVVQVFNPASTSFFFGILGLKLYFYYIPLLFVGYSLIQTESDLRRFFRFNLILICIITGLGIIQAIAGHTFLNPEHPQEDIRELSQNYRASPISGLVVYRPTSVFVSGGRFAFYLIPAWLLSFGYGGYLLLRSKQGRILSVVALALSSGAIVLAASRGVFMYMLINALIGGAAFIWGSTRRTAEMIRIMRSFQRALLALAAAVILLLVTYPDAILGRFALYTETLLPGSSASELNNRAWDYPVKNFLYAFDYPRWPYGYGIGTASLGVQYVARILHVPGLGIGVESGYGTLVLELGIVGLILWLVMSTAIVIFSWRVVRKLKGTPWFPIGFTIFWYAFLLLFPFTFGGFQAYEDFVLNSFLWLFLGILFRLPHLHLAPVLAAAPAAPSRRRWMR